MTERTDLFLIFLSRCNDCVVTFFNVHITTGAAVSVLIRLEV